MRDARVVEHQPIAARIVTVSMARDRAPLVLFRDPGEAFDAVMYPERAVNGDDLIRQVNRLMIRARPARPDIGNIQRVPPAGADCVTTAGKDGEVHTD